MIDLTENDIKHVLKMSKDDLYKMIYDMSYDDWYPYYYTFNKLSLEKRKPLYGYNRVNTEAAELGGRVVFPPEIKKKFKDLKKEWRKYQDVFNTIQSAVSDKKKSCKHVWELTGCSGYDRENDVYTCKLCGEVIYK